MPGPCVHLFDTSIRLSHPRNSWLPITHTSKETYFSCRVAGEHYSRPYRTTVESRGQFASAGRSEGNENRRWHGTRRICNLGDKGQTQFCSTPTCSLCCIIQSSFDITLWGKKTGWGRFGKGIYTSSTSSKSNDYSTNDCKSNLKAILLNKVVVGKGCKMLQDHTTLTAPPSGYDSVSVHFITFDHDQSYVCLHRSWRRKGEV